MIDLKNRWKNKGKDKTQFIFLVLLVIAIIAACGVFNYYFNGKFLTKNNISVLISHAIIPSFVAWGLCFVFACEFTDLSLGAVIVLAANAAGALGTHMGYAGIVFGGIATAMLLLTLNFVIYVKTNIPSWIAGIGMAMIYEAIAVFYSDYMTNRGGSVAQLSNELRMLGKPPYIYIVFFYWLYHSLYYL